MLSWACTVHKVQGKQFQEAVISFDLFKQRSWNNGHIYVALSRVTSLNGLYLTGEYNRSAIKADVRATIEYETMRKHHSMKPIDKCASVSTDSLTITLLNTRSLRKHAVDITSDEVISDSDIILLTETKIAPGDDIVSIYEILNDFDIVHNVSSDKFCSIACCYRNTINVNEHNCIPSISLLKLRKDSFCQNTVNILLVYRKNNSNFDHFTYSIQHLLSQEENSIHIILGDFNANYLNHDNNGRKLSDLLANYKQIITEPTHIPGSLINHVYVKETVLDQFVCCSTIKNVYFSDHDAIKINLKIR